MKVAFDDGQIVDVADQDCRYRSCFVLGFDKGPFTPGVGYTRYWSDGPAVVCWTRHLHGCPTAGYTLRCDDCGATAEKGKQCDVCGGEKTYKLFDVLLDPEPCCRRMTVSPPRTKWGPLKQRCKGCGAWLTGRRLALAREKLGASSRRKRKRTKR